MLHPSGPCHWAARSAAAAAAALDGCGRSGAGRTGGADRSVGQGRPPLKTGAAASQRAPAGPADGQHRAGPRRLAAALGWEAGGPAGRLASRRAGRGAAGRPRPPAALAAGCCPARATPPAAPCASTRRRRRGTCRPRPSRSPRPGPPPAHSETLRLGLTAWIV